METRTSRVAKREPSFGRAALGIGSVLVVALGIGLAMYPGSQKEEPTQRVAPAAAGSQTRAVRTSADSIQRTVAPQAPLVVPAVALAPAAAEPTDVATTAPRDDSSTDPSTVWGWYAHGLDRRTAGDLDEAERAFRGALALDPDHEKSLVNLARVLLDGNRAKEAHAVARHAVEIAPDSGGAQRVLGRTLHTLGVTDGALAAYGRATEIDPTDAWAWNNTGLLLIEAERFDEAVPALETACAHGSEACFFNNWGVALERTGRYAEAAVVYGRAVATEGGSDKAAANLARVTPLRDANASPVLAAGARDLGVEGTNGE